MVWNLRNLSKYAFWEVFFSLSVMSETLWIFIIWRINYLWYTILVLRHHPSIDDVVLDSANTTCYILSVNRFQINVIICNSRWKCDRFLERVHYILIHSSMNSWIFDYALYSESSVHVHRNLGIAMYYFILYFTSVRSFAKLMNDKCWIYTSVFWYKSSIGVLVKQNTKCFLGILLLWENDFFNSTYLLWCCIVFVWAPSIRCYNRL